MTVTIIRTTIVMMTITATAAATTIAIKTPLLSKMQERFCSLIV